MRAREREWDTIRGREREREETRRATRQVESYRQIAIDDRLVGNYSWREEGAREKEGKPVENGAERRQRGYLLSCK